MGEQAGPAGWLLGQNGLYLFALFSKGLGGFLFSYFHF
jgi:hypothetical protein